VRAKPSESAGSKTNLVKMVPWWLRLRLILAAVIAALALSATVAAQARSVASSFDFATKAQYAILIDADTGSVLFQKDADQPIEPASMEKLMTLAVVFDQLKSGRI
jgi:D-alanyl-D-alanine carboxypeptidase (penicillin-binding protein 5/6)